MRQIADTGFFVAFWNRTDEHHEWARSLRLSTPLLTCEAVLTEAAYLIGDAERLLRMLAEGDIVLALDPTAHAEDLLRWLERYRDLDPGYADACVVKLAELHPAAEVLTTDRRDFECYRLLSGKPLKCRFPELRKTPKRRKR